MTEWAKWRRQPVRAPGRVRRVALVRGWWTTTRTATRVDRRGLQQGPRPMGDTTAGRRSAGYMPFGFHLLHVRWDAATLKGIVRRRWRRRCREGLAELGAGQPRPVRGSSLGPGMCSERASATMLLLTLRGAPTMYYGDELGMDWPRCPPGRVKFVEASRGSGPGSGADADPLGCEPSGRFHGTRVEEGVPVADPSPGRRVTAGDPGRCRGRRARRHRGVEAAALAEGSYRSGRWPGPDMSAAACGSRRVLVAARDRRRARRGSRCRARAGSRRRDHRRTGDAVGGRCDWRRSRAIVVSLD